MIIVSLIALALSAEANLQILSDKTFISQVINRPVNEVWFVMFVTDEANETRLALQEFRNASEISSGMVKFAMLNVRRAPQIASQLELKSFPCWRIFHRDGAAEMKGKPIATNFLKVCLKFVKDFSENVTTEWKNEFTGKPSAILFTDKDKTPLWAGISSYFAKKDVRIGTCKDEAVIKAFGVTELPKIVFFNGTAQEEYKGQFKFRFVKAAIEEWFKNRFVETEATLDEQEMMMPDQFVPQCIGGKQLCVLAATRSPPEGMDVLLKSGHGRRKIKCFAGVVNLPYKFMEAGGVWIYNPRRDGFIHVTEGQNLMETMDRVIDGSAKWTRRSEYEAGNAEL